MADVLEQNEIDALLAAAEQGELQGSLTGHKEAPDTSAEISVYDFKRPERVSKDHMRALHTLHEGFSRTFGASLSAFLRSIVEVKLVSVEQLTYSEFVHSLDNPTCFNLLSAEPLEGQMILELNPSIIYPVIDRLLGGGNDETSVPKRALTEIELRLISRLTERAVATLQAVWDNVIKLDLEVTEVESNPHLVQIVPPNEVVVVIGFEIALGEARGPTNLCIPFNVIEPVMSKLSSNSWISYSKRAATQETAQYVSSRLSGSKVELVTYLASAAIKMSELVQLQPGDIIQTDKNVNSGALVCVEGVPKFRGKVGHFKGHKAIQLTSHASSKERIN